MTNQIEKLKNIWTKYSSSNASVTLKDVTLELEKRKEQIYKFNQTINCFHPNLTRENAELLLKDYYLVKYQQQQEGIWLIRECTGSLDNFSLSIIFKMNCYHYKIFHVIDTYYVIGDGVPINGLDNLLKIYQENAHGLPCCLSKVFIPCQMLPVKCRILGITNYLHETAAFINEIDKFKLIIKSTNCPHVDERDENGRTALDIACEYNNIEAVKELIRKRASVNMKALDGFTPLHRAAENCSLQSMEYLLSVANANPTERDLNDNSVPLHTAALNNNFMCVKALLKFGAPDKPRTLDNKTPLDLAIENNHTDSANILRSFEPKRPRIKLQEFLHDSNITREVAYTILVNSGFTDGSFLVRQSTKNANLHVLSILMSNEYFNYEISFKEDGRFYFIDDGPYFRSIEHLIEHHMKYEDGLPGKLLHPIAQMTPASLLATTTAISPSVASNINSQIEVITQNIENTVTLNNAKQRVSSSSPNERDTPRDNNLLRNMKQDQRVKHANMSNLQHINPRDVKLQMIIGEGEFGTVYKGTYKSKQVAVKKLKDCSADREFLREASIMGSLGNHPCILKIFGLVVDRSNLMMVQELMVCSVLEKLLNEPNLITEVHLKNWSAQIVSGMRHMEEKKIVHRDLAARNVLIASDMQIKVADFGLSRQTDSSNVYTQKTDGKIPIKWYAPESIEMCKFTSKSDVWSFGVTLWEMFTYGQVPYGNKNGSEVYIFIKSNGRLEKPRTCPKNTYNLMLKCWEWQPNRRPSFNDLFNQFACDSDYQTINSIYFDESQI